MQALSDLLTLSATQTLYAALATVALGFGSVLLILGQGVSRAYLRAWGVGLLCLGVHHVLSLTVSESSLSGWDFRARGAFSGAAISFGYLFVVWFALGVWRAVGNELPSRTIMVLTVLAIGLGLASSFPFSAAPYPSIARGIVRVGPRSALTGFILLSSAWWVFRSRVAIERPTTAFILGSAISGVALVNLYSAAISFAWIGGVGLRIGPGVRLVSLGLITILGMACVAWLAEEERAKGKRESRELKAELSSTQIHHAGFVDVSTDHITCWRLPDGIRTDLPFEEQTARILDATCVEATQPAWETIGVSSKEAVLGIRLGEVAAKLDPEPPLEEFILSGYRLENMDRTYPGPRGQLLHVIESWNGVIENEELVSLWIASKDVTKQRELETQVVQISDWERQRMGQELHDDLGQQLTGLTALSGALRIRLSGEGREEAEDAGHIEEIGRGAILYTRNLAKGLFPHDITGETLPEAIHGLAETAEAVFEVSCPISVEPRPESLTEEEALHLYRICQEAIHNAVRHGGADEVSVFLSGDEERVTLEIVDDGEGFDPMDISDGMGLAVMRNRAEILGGRIDITQLEAGGTRVFLTIP